LVAENIKPEVEEQQLLRPQSQPDQQKKIK
jgi:hypothetical protein